MKYLIFILFSDDAEEFDIVYNSANNLSLSVSDGGLQQTKDRSHLVFAIVANKSDSLEGRAAVVISLTGLNYFTYVVKYINNISNQIVPKYW